MGDVRIGISGWRYTPWRGVFYPPGMPQRLELAYAASRLGTIEINGSFYSLQRPSSYLAWARDTPEDFLFSVKGGRYLTHMLRLRGVEQALANFLASGPLALGSRLGPLLWQLPPTLAFDRGLLEDFCTLLPRTTTQAAAMAEGHDERLAGENRAWTTTDADRPLRHAVEVRHESFRDPAFAELLARNDIALVAADTAGRWPLLLEPTSSSLVYVRLHGAEELYVSGYDDDALATWADRVRAWSDSGRDVVVYFDNDVKVHAPHDARRLAEMLGVPWDRPLPRWTARRRNGQRPQ